jgi:hypothetical protein
MKSRHEEICKVFDILDVIVLFIILFLWLWLKKSLQISPLLGN